MNLFLIFILAGSVSWLLTGLLRKYALTNQLMDVPNQRSSHLVPTPRGGGVSIVLVFLFGSMLLWATSFMSNEVFIGLFGSGATVAIIGFVDDHGHIAARWRLLGHSLSVAWLVFWAGGLPPLSLFDFSVDLGWAGHLLTIAALVWMLNLYNFMDGIDGLAGSEALSATLVAGFIFVFVYDDYLMALVNFLMSAAVVGFLLWNFPPAKIFMGDAGSGFLGLMLGGVALYSIHVDAIMLWVWLILLGVFIVDATYTLVRRLLRGERVYEAHCSHAYQYASRKYNSHLKVTLTVWFINLFWLAPLSVMVAEGVVSGVFALIVAYIPLLYLAKCYRAGAAEYRS